MTPWVIAVVWVACGGGESTKDSAEVSPSPTTTTSSPTTPPTTPPTETGDPCVGPERCLDGVDDDCDGSLACSLASADHRIGGTTPGDLLGSAVAGVGDVDGDGFGDMLLGAHGSDDFAGAVGLFLGPVGKRQGLAEADRLFVGNVDSSMGLAVSGAGDVDGDGLADLVLGAPSEGDYEGSVTLVTATAETRVVGAPGDLLGKAMSPLGDIDGDGLADLLVAGQGMAEDAGAAVVMTGPSPSLESAVVIAGEAAGDLVGDKCSVGSVDANGDGVPDVVIGARGHDGGGDGAGALFLVLGPPGSSTVATADARWLGEAAGDEVGLCVTGAGDLDGDGYGDFVAGSKLHDAARGAAYVVRGPGLGEHSLADADARLLGAAEGATAGGCVASAGDVDGDGLADLLVGSSGYGEGGVAYLVSRPSGTRNLGDQDRPMVAVGEAVRGGNYLGASDVDGDGVPDLIVSAYHEADQAGAVYVVGGAAARSR